MDRRDFIAKAGLAVALLSTQGCSNKKKYASPKLNQICPEGNLASEDNSDRQKEDPTLEDAMDTLKIENPALIKRNCGFYMTAGSESQLVLVAGMATGNIMPVKTEEGYFAEAGGYHPKDDVMKLVCKQADFNRDRIIAPRESAAFLKAAYKKYSK